MAGVAEGVVGVGAVTIGVPGTGGGVGTDEGKETALWPPTGFLVTIAEAGIET
jgi:hypothetical protein